MNKKDIISQLSSIKTNLNEFGVLRIGLFGSYSKDLQTESSDIDILVEFQSELKTFDNFINVSYLLEELFNKKVEVITPESLSPGIRAIIEQILIYVLLNALLNRKLYFTNKYFS